MGKFTGDALLGVEESILTMKLPFSTYMVPLLNRNLPMLGRRLLYRLKNWHYYLPEVGIVLCLKQLSVNHLAVPVYFWWKRFFLTVLHGFCLCPCPLAVAPQPAQPACSAEHTHIKSVS